MGLTIEAHDFVIPLQKKQNRTKKNQKSVRFYRRVTQRSRKSPKYSLTQKVRKVEIPKPSTLALTKPNVLSAY